MRHTAKICFLSLLPLFITTGCWNLKEPDQLAFVAGNGLDLTKNGKLEASTLLVIPAGIGGGQINGGEKKESYQVMNATGKNVSDALDNIQSKLSRVVFAGHRDIFLVGQSLAEHGMGNTIDTFMRSSQSDMRAMIYLVKNGQPKDVFSSAPFFEPFITTTLSEEQEAIGLKPYLAREFVADVWSDATQPLLPVVSLNPSTHYSYNGSAILNKDDGVKLVGFLDKEETSYARWLTNRLISFTLTAFVSKGNGNISLSLDNLGRRIKVLQVGETIQIDVHLTGGGTIIENSTKLDSSKRKDLLLIQKEISLQTEKSTQKLVKKVQEAYKMDIFGFGESVHQQYPLQWKTLKHNWTKTFPTVAVSVSVDIRINDSGLTHSSLNKP
ncbi:Ger(x)C family spore germination protein [Neobacillus niacini]|jgi:spore germination protein KC|uniref:Ger(x)C family spore germination protein n=1 Tax=Neobacillus niacini TaxID=86668 RepID=UPI001C8E4E38|nr:Ger(x)C family spore germination protein [Neobacillus niacini]MBY0147914.1 Ger(x)C family spore germination protein [Neobacillus niacini]